MRRFGPGWNSSTIVNRFRCESKGSTNTLTSVPSFCNHTRGKPN